jgi:hypothetical protein
MVRKQFLKLNERTGTKVILYFGYMGNTFWGDDNSGTI